MDTEKQRENNATTVTMQAIAEMAFRCAEKVENGTMNNKDGSSIANLLCQSVGAAKVQLQAHKELSGQVDESSNKKLIAHK